MKRTKTTSYAAAISLCLSLLSEAKAADFSCAKDTFQESRASCQRALLDATTRWTYDQTDGNWTAVEEARSLVDRLEYYQRLIDAGCSRLEKSSPVILAAIHGLAERYLSARIVACLSGEREFTYGGSSYSTETGKKRKQP